MAGEQPKKALTPFFRFLQDNRADIAKEAGSGAAGPLAKLGSEKWKALPAAQKKIYEDNAAAARVEYDKAIAAFKAIAAIGGELKKRKSKKEVEASEQPKKALTPFFRWLHDNRADIAKEAGSGAAGPIAKLGSEKWKALPAAQKKIYEDNAAAAKVEYDKAIEAFKSGGGEHKKRKSKNDVEAGETSKKYAKKEKDPNAPKKPPNPYWLWMSDNRADLTKECGSGGAKAIGKIAGEKWKAAPQAIKDAYEKKAADAKAKYAKELEEYKKKGGVVDGKEDEGEDS